MHTRARACAKLEQLKRKKQIDMADLDQIKRARYPIGSSYINTATINNARAHHTH